MKEENTILKQEERKMQVHGMVEPGFEAVQTQFARNFAARGEVGAACTIYHRGRKVVDLWGGYRDQQTHAPWEDDTLVLIYSSTKGLAALALAVAHSRGFFDYDTPLATYWPEFAQQGKEHITVRQVLAHQAGLSVIDEPLTPALLADHDTLATILARQRPVWKPGTRQGYHAFSLGFYECELIRRTDPQHRTIGQFFQDELARPLGLEFYMGMPASVSASRIATMMETGRRQKLFVMPPGLLLSLLSARSITRRTFSNPAVSSNLAFNSPEYRAVEFPSVGGIGLVDSIARAYSAFATGGKELGIQPATLDALKAAPILPTGRKRDLVLHVNIAYSLGFLKPFTGFRFGTNEKAFGMAGSGGSLGFADPEAQVGYAYAMNMQGPRMWNDSREQALRKTFYRCLNDMRG